MQEQLVSSSLGRNLYSIDDWRELRWKG